ncbi:MAG: trigger factor [Alphaproteobacteria bacterium]|nr:trigger factor [Alphaproteobacteria bacterium]
MTQNKLAHTLTLTIPAADFAAKMDAKLADIQKEARLPGFRPGQAPMTMIRKKYENAAKGEVLDALVQDAVQKKLADEKIRPALRPKVELTDAFEDGKDISVKIDAEALPDIVPADMGKIELTRMKAEATDAEIDAALAKLRESKKTTEIIAEDRPAQNGDVIVIDFTGTIDGAAFKGGAGKDYYLGLGSNTFIPGFEEQLVGKKAGDKADVSVSFPADYHAKELAGKKAVFHVDVKELRAWKLPELTDAFAKLFGMDSVERLKNTIRDELNKEYAQVARTHAKRALLDILEKEHDFDIPQGMADLEFDMIWKQYEDAKARGQLDEEDKGKPEDALKQEYRKIAERRVRLGLLLAEIATANHVALTQEDLTNAVMREARRFPGQEKAVFDYYAKNPQALDQIKAPLFEEKVVDYILGVARVSDKAVSVAELYAFDPDKK